MKSLNTFLVHKAAVLGSGVMGSQIAAHLANANVQVVLFDLRTAEGGGQQPNAIVQKALQTLQKLEPSPLVLKSKVNLIQPANYDDHLELLRDCDFIVEAISERMDFKQNLYQKIAPYISDKTIFATNTSGLSIEALAQTLPQKLRTNFCGVHFFNPPRYMMLVELIAHKHTNSDVLNQLESFLTKTLGKGVVRAKDTPNFIANRIGVFSMLSTIYHTQQFKLGFDEVDVLTGVNIGRAKSATYRTLDVVGVDTFAHVTKTMLDNLPTIHGNLYLFYRNGYKHLFSKENLAKKQVKVFTKKLVKIFLFLILKKMITV